MRENTGVTIPDSEIEALLSRWPVARLATTGAEGWPHQVPIVFAWQGGCIWSPVDGKPKREGELARVANVKRQPQVSVLLDHYDEDWLQLWWVRIEGRADICHGEEALTDCAAPLAALRDKYPQYQSVALLRDPPVLIRVRPVVTRSWCAA